MDREQMGEFSAIRETASTAVRGGALGEFEGVTRILQFLILPSFDNSVSWELVRRESRNGRAEVRLFRTCWRMDVDLEAMRTPVARLRHPRPYLPTIEADSVPFDESALEATIESLRTTRIPVAISSTRLGLDGTSYELTIGDGFNGVSLRWWCELPDEWSNLRTPTAEIEMQFDLAWKRGRDFHDATRMDRYG